MNDSADITNNTAFSSRERANREREREKWIMRWRQSSVLNIIYSFAFNLDSYKDLLNLLLEMKPWRKIGWLGFSQVLLKFCEKSP